MVGSHRGPTGAIQPSSHGAEQRFKPYELAARPTPATAHDHAHSHVHAHAHARPTLALPGPGDSKLQLRDWHPVDSETESEVEEQILPLAADDRAGKRARWVSPDSDEDVFQVHKLLATHKLSADVREITRMVKKLDPSFPVVGESPPSVESQLRQRPACSKNQRRKGTKAVRQRRAVRKARPTFIADADPVAEGKMSSKAAGKRPVTASMMITSDYERDAEAMHEVERAMGISDHWIPPMKNRYRQKHRNSFSRGHRSKRHVSHILLQAVAGHFWLEAFYEQQAARKIRLDALRADHDKVAHISFAAVLATWWYPAECRSRSAPWWIEHGVMPLVWPSGASSGVPLYPAQPQAVFPSPYVPTMRKRNAESAFRLPQFEAPGDEVSDRWARRNELRLGEEVVPFANYIRDVLHECRSMRLRQQEEEEAARAAIRLSPAEELVESELVSLSPPPRYATPMLLPRHLRPRCNGRAPVVNLDPPNYIRDIFSTRSPPPPPPYNACTDRESLVCDVLESPRMSGAHSYPYSHRAGARVEVMDEDEVDTVEASMAPMSVIRGSASPSLRYSGASRIRSSPPLTLTIGAYPAISSLPRRARAAASSTPIVAPRPVRATAQRAITQWDHALDLEDQPIYDVDAMFDEHEHEHPSGAERQRQQNANQQQRGPEGQEAAAAAGVSSGLRAIGRWLGWRR